MESQDNPFLMNGELMKKADYIINNSTISRKRIRIADPDLVKSESSHQTAVETQSKPVTCSEIVKIGGAEVTGTTCLSKDDLVVMDICSSDSNKDQSSLEDVRSLTTIDRSPSHIREIPSNQQSEVRCDANSHPSDAHDRLLVNLPEEDMDFLETSRPLLPHQTSNSEAVEHPLTSAQKANGTNPHLRSNQPKSSETSTNSKTGANSRAKKKKKCCLLQWCWCRWWWWWCCSSDVVYKCRQLIAHALSEDVCYFFCKFFHTGFFVSNSFKCCSQFYLFTQWLIRSPIHLVIQFIHSLVHSLTQDTHRSISISHPAIHSTTSNYARHYYWSLHSNPIRMFTFRPAVNYSRYCSKWPTLQWIFMSLLATPSNYLLCILYYIILYLLSVPCPLNEEKLKYSILWSQ